MDRLSFFSIEQATWLNHGLRLSAMPNNFSSGSARSSTSLGPNHKAREHILGGPCGTHTETQATVFAFRARWAAVRSE